MVKKLLGHFIKMNYKKNSKKNLGQKEKTRKKRNTLYVKWKDYDNSFTSSIDKKDIVKQIYKK